MKRRTDKFKFYDLVIYAARGSHSARTLANALGSRRWRDDLPERYTRRRPYFRGNPSPMVINWGSTVHPHWLEDARFRLNPVFVNGAEGVGRAIDKVEFFKALAGKPEIPLLRWTTERDRAIKWLATNHPVVVRTKTKGSAGEGIRILRPGEHVPEAPLYTRYYPKTHEFRVHVFDGKAIDFTQKKLKGGTENATSGDRSIRNLNNGWVHCHNDYDVDGRGIEEMGAGAIRCINDLGLVFGAVDILATLDKSDVAPNVGVPPFGGPPRHLKNYVICEVNTGPGLENTKTIEAYKTAILSLKEKNRGNNNNRVPKTGNQS